MKDAHSGIKVVSAIDAANLKVDSTPAAIDRQGFNSVEFVLSVGVGGITFDGSNHLDFVLSHSNDDVTYDLVSASDVLGAASVTSGVIKSIAAAHAAAKAYRFGYVGGRRYLKLKADFVGSIATETALAAVAILGNVSNDTAPVANQA